MPFGRIDPLDLIKLFRSHSFKAFQIEIFVFWNPPNGGLQRMSTLLAALDDPLEDAHVVTKAGPEELTLAALAEPVHMKDAWQMLHQTAHLQPVGEVVAHVVAAEGEHRHRITSHLADRAGGSCRHLGADRGTKVDAVHPVEGLEDQWHRCCSTTTKDHGAYLDALGVFPVGIDDRAVLCRRSETAVRMTGEDGFSLGILLARGPVVPLPVN